MLEEQLKKINELSFQANKTKDEKEKEQLENDVKSIIFDLKKQAIESFKSESDIKKFLDNIIKFNNYSYNYVQFRLNPFIYCVSGFLKTIFFCIFSIDIQNFEA